MTMDKLRRMILVTIAMATFITLSVIILINNKVDVGLIAMCISFATIYLVFANTILIYNVIYLLEEKKSKE